MLASSVLLTIPQRLEQARIVAVAQDAYLEHGLAAISPEQVAFTMRLPLATVVQYFPTGKTAALPADK